MIYIGVLIGIASTVLCYQVLATWLTIRAQREMRGYQERTLAALEERNNIGWEMVEAIKKLQEGKACVKNA